MNYHKRALALTASAALAAMPVFAQTAATSEETVQLDAFVVTELADFADLAIAGETPISFTELSKATITEELGSRDIPLVLNTAPSVYATTDSGGAGDARVNVRGFSQRQISILINGVPTNDIENGWLYWSNWDGIGDVTTSIQLQRGLSNVTLPTPSVGGTMNILTDPSASSRGGSVKTEFGSDSFFKVSGVFNTGLIDDKFALTIAGVSKTGDGYARGLWTEGKGYYVGATWFVNDTNTLELYAIGAPQEHGQRTFASNIAAYDADYARSLGYTDADLAGALSRGPVDAGLAYNPNYAPVSSGYTGQQYYWGQLQNRVKSGGLNERQNYFHKPQVNLNWFSEISDVTKLATVFYYSGGRGGGSGSLDLGSGSDAFARYDNSHPLYGSNIDWDATIANNAGSTGARGRPKTPGQSLGILRNSVNNQDQYGIISKLTHSFTESTDVTVGIDWRTAEIAHYRTVRDLLGGDYFIGETYHYSEFDTVGRPLGLGDKVDYYNVNNVDWLGLFAQAQYKEGPLTAFGVYGYSTIEYAYEDRFRRASAGSSDTFKLNPGAIDGHQIKGGANYELSENLSVYGNAGWVSKVPIFDGVIDDVTGRLIDPTNEKFTSFETGLRWEKGNFNVSANLYFTQWRDRTVTEFARDANDDDIIVYLRGVDSDYNGLEIDAAYKINDWVRLDAAASFGDWTYTNDVSAEARYVSTGLPASSATALYIKDLKVGDAPQTQIAYAVTFFPIDGLSVKLQGRWYDRYWSDFAPDGRTDPTDRAQAWRIPSYAVYDVHVNYNIPTDFGPFDATVFLHVFNVLDEVYVADATDESSFESISGAAPHSAQRAEAFLGAPLTFNAGVSLRF
jgi:outer membrane cobalamin receptor